jgi:hypothetical protein
MADFRIDRRRFLAGLISVGATIRLTGAVEAATPAEIEDAWTDLLKDPWIFKVSDRTIVDEAVEEPKLWGDVFDHLSGASVDFSEIEGCPPLLAQVQYHAEMHLEDIRQTLLRQFSEVATCPNDPKKARRLNDLLKLSVQLESEDDRWKAWVELEGQSELEEVVEEWLQSPLDWSQSEWFPVDWGGQGRAFGYFSSLDRELLYELGVAIVEGDRPGSTYFAAELRQPVLEANKAAARLGLPFRFE